MLFESIRDKMFDMFHGQVPQHSAEELIEAARKNGATASDLARLQNYLEGRVTPGVTYGAFHDTDFARMIVKAIMKESAWQIRFSGGPEDDYGHLWMKIEEVLYPGESTSLPADSTLATYSLVDPGFLTVTVRTLFYELRCRQATFVVTRSTREGCITIQVLSIAAEEPDGK